jgi:hypothetical protein
MPEVSLPRKEQPVSRFVEKKEFSLQRLKVSTKFKSFISIYTSQLKAPFFL